MISILITGRLQKCYIQQAGCNFLLLFCLWNLPQWSASSSLGCCGNVTTSRMSTSPLLPRRDEITRNTVINRGLLKTPLPSSSFSLFWAYLASSRLVISYYMFPKEPLEAFQRAGSYWLETETCATSINCWWKPVCCCCCCHLSHLPSPRHWLLLLDRKLAAGPAVREEGLWSPLGVAGAPDLMVNPPWIHPLLCKYSLPIGWWQHCLWRRNSLCFCQDRFSSWIDMGCCCCTPSMCLDRGTKVETELEFWRMTPVDVFPSAWGQAGLDG